MSILENTIETAVSFKKGIIISDVEEPFSNSCLIDSLCFVRIINVTVNFNETYSKQESHATHFYVRN